MFEVAMYGEMSERKKVGNLRRKTNDEGSHTYGINLDKYTVGIHMDSFIT
jgi:hypothetical protein